MVENEPKVEPVVEPEPKEKVDITSMSSLLVTKDDIDFSMQIPFKENGKDIYKIILKKNDSQKRVGQLSEVRFYVQKYLYNKEKKEFLLGNKDYKNPLKKKIDKMTSEEAILRKCLLQLFDGHVVLFLIDKTLDEVNFERCLKDQKVPKEEIEHYENILYYRVGIDIILNPHPKEPTKVSEFIGFTNKFYEEIKYLIIKENYSDAESWCNAIISKVFTMKKSLKKDFDEPKNAKIKKEVMKIMKKIVLNKAFCIDKKPGDMKTSRFERGVKCVENDYYKNYPNEKNDESYMKITGRLCNFYIKMRQFENAEKAINDIKKNCKSLENCANVVNDLEATLKKERGTQKKSVKKKMEEFLKDPKMNVNILPNDNFEWDTSIQRHELGEYFSKYKMGYSVKELLKVN